MGGIDHDDVSTGSKQGFGAFLHIRSDTDGRPHSQATHPVLAGPGILSNFLDILDGDHAGEFPLIVHHQQFFYAMPVQHLLGFLQRDPLGNGNQIILGHHFGNLFIRLCLKSQIPIGDNPRQSVPAGDGNP